MLTRVLLVAAAMALAATPLAAQEMEKEKGMMKDKMAMAGGHFTGTDGHKASGSFTIEAGTIAFADDFVADRGPDVYVVLSPTPTVTDGKALYLGKLAKFNGKQSYTIPAGTNLAGYSHVVLWCKRYGKTMGLAALPHEGMKHDAMMQKDDMMKKDGMMKKDEMKQDEMKRPDPKSY